MARRLLASVGTYACCLALGLAVGLALGLGAANAQNAHYAGKTITILVGYDSGQTDLTARTLARHLEKNIAGNPTVIVKNMPGAGTMKAQNYVHEIAQPDGLTVGFNPFLVMGQLTSAPGLRFKYQDVTFVAGVLTTPFMAVARTDVAGGLRSPADILKGNDLKYTGRHPTNAIDVTATAALDALGVKYTFVGGHRGDAPIAKSLEQGETQLTGSSLSAWKNFQARLVADGKLTKLWYHPRKGPDGKYVADPNYAEWKSFPEVWREVHKKEPSGELWEAYDFANEMLGTATWIVAGPPNMDKAATSALREGMKKTMASAEFQADATKVVGNALVHVGFDEAKRALERLKAADTKTMSFWKERAERLVK